MLGTEIIILSSDRYTERIVARVPKGGTTEDIIGFTVFSDYRAFLRDLAIPCPGNTNGDSVVDTADLLALLSLWGKCPGDCPADFDGNGVVDTADLLELLANWGPCP